MIIAYNKYYNRSMQNFQTGVLIDMKKYLPRVIVIELRAFTLMCEGFSLRRI